MATLHAQNIVVGYGKQIIVPQASVRFEEGEIVSVIGPNGSGKSTLLKALSRLLPVADGEVHLNERPIKSYKAREIARKIAVLPQGAVAPPDMNVYRLVSCGRSPHHGYFEEYDEHDDAVVEYVMRETDIWKYRERAMYALSGGERQRVWLAMALAQEPEILLLDEPTTYLDIHHQLRLMDLVAETHRRRHITVIMVLHDLNQAARYSQRIIAMKNGEIVGDGAPDEVMTVEHMRDWFGIHMKPLAIRDDDDVYRFYLPLSVAGED